jgi:hypothetical protein
VFRVIECGQARRVEPMSITSVYRC